MFILTSIKIRRRQTPNPDKRDSSLAKELETHSQPRKIHNH
jgi:hypothetical protein